MKANRNKSPMFIHRSVHSFSLPPKQHQPVPTFRRQRPKRARRKDHSQKIDIFSNHDSDDVPQNIFASFPPSQRLSNYSSIGQMLDTSLDDLLRVWDTFQVTVFPYQQQLSNQSNIGQETDILPNRDDALLGAFPSPQQLPDQSSIGQQIDILPDDVLLEIFAFYLQFNSDVEAWHTLVHVCRLWRLIVFASTRRLDIQILCTHKTPAREISNVWPALPIQIKMSDGYSARPEQDIDNIIAALAHNDRISQIMLTFYQSSLQERLAAMMQQPFPSLTYLNLELCRGETLVLPEEFLGGSVPRLRSCYLDGIASLRILKLLLTSHHLVDLSLHHIPQSSYISPEAMVPYLSAMPNLKQLHIGFRSPQSHLDWFDPSNGRPPPLIRVVLPALTSFSFYGVSEYAEDLVSRIDVPLLNYVYIRFFNQPIFYTPRLHDFLSRAEPLMAHNRATLRFGWGLVNFERNSTSLLLTIFCLQSDRQLSAMAQLCSSSLPPFSDLEALQICAEELNPPYWLDNMEHSRWLELMHPFSSVKNLYLSENVAPRVALALKEPTGEGVRVTLPALQNLFVEGLMLQPEPTLEAITQFIITRWLSGYPVAVHGWDGKW